MKKKVFLFTLLSLIFLLTPPKINALEAAKSSLVSASLNSPTQKTVAVDSRAIILRKFLEKYDSPLASYSEIFVKAADDNHIDWKLVVAISGVESTFAHQIPNNSYNAWGWGIYGDHVTYFKSYEDGIITLSKGLRQNYIDKLGSDDIYAIGKFYAASPTWASHVNFFLERIGNFQVKENSSTQSMLIE